MRLGFFMRDGNTLRRIEDKLDSIQKELNKIMATLDDTLAAVTQEKTDIGSLNAFVAGLQAQLAAALAGTTIPPATQAKIDAIFAGVTDNDAAVKALQANVPPTPAA